MILLSDWANFRKSPTNAPPDKEDAGGQEDDASVVELIDLLMENVQVASRYSQAAQIRHHIDSKLDSVAAKMALELHADLEKLRAEIDRQLKVLFSPFLNEKLEAKAIEDFCSALAAAVGKDASRHLVISVPPELQKRLESRLELSSLKTSIVHAEGEEISASVEATEITTEIGKWKTDLQRLLT